MQVVKDASKQSSLAFPITNNWKGVLWKCSAMFFFAVINCAAAILQQKGNFTEVSMHPAVISFYQNVFCSLFILPWLFNKQEVVFKSASNPLNILRVLLGVVGIILLYSAAGNKNFSLLQITTLQFLGPVVMIFSAYFILNENLSWYKILPIILSVTAVQIINKSDMNTSTEFSWANPYLLIPALSSVTITISKTLGRLLAIKGDSSKVLTSTIILYMTPFSFILACIFGYEDLKLPNLFQLNLLLIMGFSAFMAHYSMSKTYQYAEISFVAPFGISKILFSMIIGIIVFSEASFDIYKFAIGFTVLLVSAIMLSKQKS